MSASYRAGMQYRG